MAVKERKSGMMFANPDDVLFSSSNNNEYWGYKPEDYLDTLDNIEAAKNNKKYLEEHPEETDEEVASYIDFDIECWEKELKDMRADWKPNGEPNMDEEIERIKKWVEERKRLLDEITEEVDESEELDNALKL